MGAAYQGRGARGRLRRCRTRGSGKEGPSLDRWTGEFTERGLEAAYEQASLGASRATAFVAIFGTTLASLSFLPLDLQLIGPPDLYLFVGIRCVILVLGVCAFLVVRREDTLRGIIIATYVQQILFYFLNGIIFDHPALTRHGGLLLPIMALALPMLLPGRIWLAALVGAYGPLISLLFWGALKVPPESPLISASSCWWWASRLAWE